MVLAAAFGGGGGGSDKGTDNKTTRSRLSASRREIRDKGVHDNNSLEHGYSEKNHETHARKIGLQTGKGGGGRQTVSLALASHTTKEIERWVVFCLALIYQSLSTLTQEMMCC